MKAKKCDRCGEFYELEDDYMVCLINQARHGMIATMDICPDCYEELIRYLTNPNSIVCDVNGEYKDE